MSRIRHPVLLTALLTAVLGVVMPASASFAAQQVTQSLTPPPPPFLTCKAAGNGTICHGSRTFTIDPYPDFVCPDGEQIYDQGIIRQVATRYYDSDGNLTQRVIHEFWSDAQKSNPVTGATAPTRRRPTSPTPWASLATSVRRPRPSRARGTSRFPGGERSC